MKAITKDYFREIKSRKGQFISMFLIVFIGAAFFSGIRSGKSAMEYTINRFFVDNKFMDIQVISTVGFDDDDIDAIKDISGVNKVYPSYSAEAFNDYGTISYVMKVLAYEKEVNTPIIKKGRNIKNKKECLIDEEYATTTGTDIGDTIILKAEDSENIKDTLKYEEYKVVGIANHPMYLAIDRGAATIGNGSIDYFVILHRDVFKSEVYTDAYITIDDIAVSSIYDKKYMDKLKDITNKVVKLGYKQCDNKIKELKKLGLIDIPEINWYVLNRDDNVGFHDYIQESERVDSVGKVFPIIFFIIASLICLTSMTRLVEDHRQQIGTLKALGYSDSYVFGRYVSFAMFPTLIGSVLGVLFGEKFFPYTIMEVYYVLYTGNTKYYTPYNWYYGLIAIIACVCSTMVATIIACKKSVDTRPSELMRPKAPSSGKVFFFERFRTWKSFSFIVKAAIRNILRYRKRLFMTLIGLGGCMGLIVVACGLSDSIKVIPRLQFKEIITYDIAAVMKDTASDKEIDNIYKQMDEHRDIKYAVKVYGSKATLAKNKKNVELNMMIPEKNKVFEQCITLRDRESGEIYEMPGEGVIVSEKAAKLLGVKEGDTLFLEINGKEKVKVKIAYITETYFHHYLYMSKEYYEKIYDEKLHINQVYGVYDKHLVTDYNITIVNDEIVRELKGNKNMPTTLLWS